MALWPFIFFRSKEKSEDYKIVNHEKIHHRQQLETLLLVYYVWYFVEYWYWMFKNGFKHDKAYRSISFEREAYANESDFDYLKNRKFLSNIKYMKSND
jgi:hypothetical protein